MELIGTTVGNCRIDRLLGEGSMGPLYQAYHTSLKQDVAIKFISPDATRQTSFRERFTEQARAMSEMDHPGIVRVFDFGQYRDQLYIVMECIAGGNLRDLLDGLIRKRDWLPLAEAILMIEQLCQTVEYAEQQNLLHRDIKPANLMLKPEPAEGVPFQVVLTDLGLGQLVESSGTPQEGSYVGTPAYMSPEQVLGHVRDARSTVYSLGILLYELVVGILPFSIQTLADAVIYHTKEAPPQPRSIRPEVSESLEQVILKTLEKDPNNRYQSASDLETALVGVIGDKTDLVGQAGKPEVSLAQEYENQALAPKEEESAQGLEAASLGRTELQSAPVTELMEIPPSIDVPQTVSIELLAVGRNPQVFSFSADSMTLGRDSDNEIVIDDAEVSRQHVRLTRDGSNYYVTDLSSRNGTFIEKKRILSGIQHKLGLNQDVRIGASIFRLIPEQQPKYPTQDSRSLTQMSPALIRDIEPGAVGLSITPQQFTLEAGEKVAATLTVRNPGLQADRFSLSVSGIPSSWISNLPSDIELKAGEQKEFTFSLHAPRSSQARAGRHQVTVKTVSRRDPSQIGEVKLTFTLAAYSQFGAELQLPHLRTGQMGQLTITNRGNVEELFTVQFIDLSGELSFQPPQLQVRVPPGRAAITQYRGYVQPSMQSMFGGEKTYSYNTQVRLPDGEAQTLRGELHNRGVIPVWLLTIMLLACLLATGASAAALWYYTHRSVTLTVIANGSGIVTSLPAGINCSSSSSDCASPFRDNTIITLVAEPTPPSVFGGWSGADCSSDSLTCEIKVSADRPQTVTAIFNPPGSQTLIVNRTGTGNGSVTSSPEGIDCGSTCSYAFTEGTSVTLNAVAILPSTFGGWSGADCSGTSSTCIVTLNGPQTVITAVFSPPGSQTLTVIKSGSGGGKISSAPDGINNCNTTCTFGFAYGQTVTLKAEPEAGSTFASWSNPDCPANVTTCTVTMTTPQSVTATFNSLGGQTLTVVKSGDGAGKITSSPAGINGCNTTCTFNFSFGQTVTLTAVTDPGSTFVGWGGACSGSVCTVTMNAPQTVTATFNPPTTQKLTVQKDGSGKVAATGVDCGSDCDETYPFNTSVTLTAIPDAGFTFTGWSGDCSGTVCALTMNASKNVTATFKPNQTLKVTPDNAGAGGSKVVASGIDCGSDCEESYPFNTPVTLNALPDPDATFIGWSGDCTGTSPCNLTMNATKNVTATFRPKQKLNVDVSGSGKVTALGIVCNPDCEQGYITGTQVTLTAVQDAGFVFSGWSGDCVSTEITCTVTMNAPKRVTATFKPKLTMHIQGPGRITALGIDCDSDCDQTYALNTSVKLTAVPDPGATFTGWSGGSCTGTDPTCTLTMDTPKTVIATFSTP